MCSIATLSKAEIQIALTGVPAWQLQAGRLVRTWTLPSFRAAIDFVVTVAALAEQANHHPDIDIRYNRVRLSLTTHDSGGLTGRDFALATRLDRESP